MGEPLPLVLVICPALLLQHSLSACILLQVCQVGHDEADGMGQVHTGLSQTQVKFVQQY